MRCAYIGAILCLVAKNGEEKTLRGKPLRTPQRVLVGATLPLRATRREGTQLQRLRARLKKRPRSLEGKNPHVSLSPPRVMAAAIYCTKEQMFFSSLTFEARRGVKQVAFACLQQKQNLWILFRKRCKCDNAFW